jgi:hypothetical protein
MWGIDSVCGVPARVSRRVRTNHSVVSSNRCTASHRCVPHYWPNLNRPKPLGLCRSPTSQTGVVFQSGSMARRVRLYAESRPPPPPLHANPICLRHARNHTRAPFSGLVTPPFLRVHPFCQATAAAPLGTQNLVVSSSTRMSGSTASGCRCCARAIAAQTQTKFGSLRASISPGSAA